MNGWNPFSVAWTFFALVWLIAAFRTKRTQERAPFGTRLAYGIPVVVGAYLLAATNAGLARIYPRIIPNSAITEDIGLFLTIAGIAFAIWARFYIGENWSSAVTVKVDHQLVRSGPYSLVRHPIYSGILLAIVGTAVAEGRIFGLMAIPFFWIGFWIKSRIEERFMLKTFGDQYVEYSQSTGALVPKLHF